MPALALLWPRRVKVAGDSMRPTFEPGDRLLVGPLLRIRPGQIVAVADPREPRRLLVKRVQAVSADGSLVDVRGDNPSSSTDSRVFGPVARSTVVGRVLYRYAPRARVSRISH